MKSKKSNGTMTLADLKLDPKNARRHSSRNIDMIAASLDKVGTARSGVIDETGRILAGNGTYQALGKAGIKRVKIVDAKGDEWVVVRRTGLTAKQKQELSLADNRSAELADWDIDTMQGLDLDLTQWFEPYELVGLGIVSDGKPNDANAQWKGMPECENQDLSAWKSIRVNFDSPKSLKAFAKLLKQPLTENTRSIWYPAAEIGRTADKRYASSES